MITAYCASPSRLDGCALICYTDDRNDHHAKIVYGRCDFARVCLDHRNKDKSQDRELHAALDRLALPDRATAPSWQVSGGLALKVAGCCAAGKTASPPESTPRVAGILVDFHCICVGTFFPRKPPEFTFLWSHPDVRRFEKALPDWVDPVKRMLLRDNGPRLPEFSGKTPQILNGLVGRTLCLGLESAVRQRAR